MAHGGATDIAVDLAEGNVRRFTASLGRFMRIHYDRA
jgi:hypothetical protein